MSNKPTAEIRTNLILEPMPTIEEGDPAPKQVMALPWGANELKDAAMRERFDEPGTLEVNARTATEVADNFATRSTDFFVNLDHMRGKAYGLIEAVSVIEGEGIYLSVDWTTEGAALVVDRAYRYSSIEVILDASAWMVDQSPAVVVAVVGLALTNKPAVVGQTPVAYQTLTAALSASDGREIDTRQNTLGETEEKGDRMASDFWKTFLSRAVGKELVDEVDAATETAKLSEIRKNHEQVTVDLADATSKVTELTEQLDTANKTISEFEEAGKARAEAEKVAQVETALTEGRLAQSVADAAKEDPETFLAAAEKTPKGTFSPPKGRQVSDGVVAGADSTSLTGNETAAVEAEVRAHLKAHPELKGHYGNAWLAVTKEREAATKGKGV